MNIRTKNYLKRFIFLFILFILFSQSPLFKIKNIQIQQQGYSENSDLKKSYQQLINKNIFTTFFQLKMTPLPDPIKKINIALSPPSILHLNIIEKEPWVALNINEKNLFISQDGALLDNIIHTHNLSHLPIILNASSLFNEKKKFSLPALKMLKEIHSSCDLLFPLQTWFIEKNNDHTWTLYLNDTIIIKLENKLNSIKSQLTRLHTLFDDNKIKNNVKYIDLRIPKKVIIKYE